MGKIAILCHSVIMKWIGLTGGIASGKTTVANMFRELGVPVVDADRLAHVALERNKDKIISLFGPEVLDDQGQLDRRKLGFKVFKDAHLLKKLESLIHPFVREKVEEKRRLFEVADQKLAIYDVPLLFENQLQKDFDEVILVYVPEEVSKKRLIERNGLTDQEVEDRMQSQMSIEKKKELADVVINNEGDRDELRQKVREYFDAQ
jgi:dephospho-CoA kinase